MAFRALLVGLLCFVAACSDSFAASAAKLSLIGEGAATRAVALSRNGDGAFAGALNLGVRNDTRARVRLTLKFYGDGKNGVLPVSVGTRPLALALTLRSFAPGASRVVPLAAQLEPGEQPSDLDGALVIQARDTAGKLLTTTEVRLTGAVSVPKGVTFEPASLALQVTRFWPLHLLSGDHANVRLRGPGVAALVDDLRSPVTLLLGADSGNQTLVALQELRLRKPGLADGTVTTDVLCGTPVTACGHVTPSPGAYKGALSLAPGTDDSPVLNVSVQSQQWLLLPILLVLGGALLGGLLPQLTQVAQIKDVMRGELRTSLADFDAARRYFETAELLWDIGPTLGKKPWFETRYRGLPGDPGVATLWADIHSARTMDDLIADADRVRAVCDAVRRWIDALPLAVDLDELDRRPPSDRGGHPWVGTEMRRSTTRLLVSLRRRSPPKDDAELEDLKRQLRGQAQLHREFVAAWERYRELKAALSSEEADRRQAEMAPADLDAFDQTLPELAKDDPDFTKRLVALADVREAIEKLLDAKKRGVLPSAGETEISETRLAAVEVQLEADDPLPPTEIAELARVPVDIVTDKIANATHRWLAVESASRASADAQARSSRLMRGVGARFTTTNWALTVLIAAATAVVYCVPLYKGTWGTWQDCVTAVAAGLAGQVAINWAVLPAWRSRRLPKTTA